MTILRWWIEDFREDSDDEFFYLEQHIGLDSRRNLRYT